MDDVVIVAAGRTAVGKFGGSLAKIPASELGAHVIKGLLAHTGIDPNLIGEAILGQVLTAAVGQIAARQAVIKAGLPSSIPAFTINKVCGSGLDPEISLAAALYQAPRVARVRAVPLAQVENVIAKVQKTAYIGFFGEPRVNVLELNLALDAMAK